MTIVQKDLRHKDAGGGSKEHAPARADWQIDRYHLRSWWSRLISNRLEQQVRYRVP
jgi:hypothetical protein